MPSARPDDSRVEAWREAVERFRRLSADHARAGDKEAAHFAHLHVGYCEFFLRAAEGKPAPRQSELFGRDA